MTIAAATVEFVDDLPPARPFTPSEAIAEFAATVRQQPGRWAIYPWSSNLGHRTLLSRASDINRHRGTPSLRTGFEAAVRDGVMYVRYIGRGEH